MGRLEELQELRKHTGRVWCVAWHPKGEALASCGEDKTIRIWARDISGKWTNKCVLTDGHQRTIREIAWSPSGNNIACASFDATTSIWDRKSGEFECNTTLEGHENEVKSVAWSKSGMLLATCSRDKSVWVWEISDDDEYECAALLNAHTQDVKKVVFHPTKDLLASASYDNTVKLFREDPADNDWICIANLSAHSSTVWSLAFDKTGTFLASCSDDTTVKIWHEFAPADTATTADNVTTINQDPTWKCVCTLSGYHTRTVYDVSWCHLTGLLATACGDDIVRVFKKDEPTEGCGSIDSMVVNFSLVSDGQQRAHVQDVNCVSWNPVLPGLLASCSDDGDIKLWQFKE